MNKSRGGYGALPGRERQGTNPFEDDEPDAYSGQYQQQQGFGIPDQSNNYSLISDEISGNIFKISSNSQSLDRAAKQIGTNKDSDQLRERIHQTEQHTNLVINETAQSLRKLAGICRYGTRHEGLQFERLKGQFQDAVKTYNAFQKKVATKVKSAVILNTQQKEKDLMSFEDDTDGFNQRQKQMTAGFDDLHARDQIVDSELALMREREERIVQLETDILDINEIFKELGTLVHEQGDTIDSIEHNVENAHSHVESGNEQLRQAVEFQRRSRKKKCILILILLAILAVITIIVVISVKTHK